MTKTRRDHSPETLVALDTESQMVDGHEHLAAFLERLEQVVDDEWFALGQLFEARATHTHTLLFHVGLDLQKQRNK